MLYEIVFSPTGGTQKVADRLAAGLTATVDATATSADEIVVIDLSDPQLDVGEIAIKKEDRAVIAMPDFGGLVPEVAVERLKRLAGNGARAAVVCVYGNRAFEDGLVMMEDAARDAGFTVVAGVAAIAEHSIMHQYATGRPDATDDEHLKAAAAAIAVAFASDDAEFNPPIPGDRPYKKPGGAGLVPEPDKTCIRCGACAKSCPVEAIDYDHFKADKRRCIGCMRCVSVCPVGARHVNKLMVSVAAKAIKKAAEVRKEVELFI